MSFHNNNLNNSSHARCACGRYATIGEWKAGIGLIGKYECPDCLHHRLRPLTRQQYYNSFGIKTDPKSN